MTAQLARSRRHLGLTSSERAAGAVRAKDALAGVAAEASRGSNAVQDCVQVLCDFGCTLEYRSQANLELMKDAVAAQACHGAPSMRMPHYGGVLARAGAACNSARCSILRVSLR